MYINIITVGNKPRPELLEMITNYLSRLPRNLQVSWTYLKHGSGNSSESMRDEAEKILSNIKAQDYVVLLDETGQQLKSESFSEKFMDSGNNIVFIIGGAYGVANSVKLRANFTLSLSKLVLPHQIVRLILSEQIYRAHTISIGHPYHHS